MYPIFEPGQKKFSSNSNNEWDKLDRELWVCKIVTGICDPILK